MYESKRVNRSIVNMSLPSVPMSKYCPFYDEKTGNLRGYIQKWTNYMTGYQQRYVVIKDGTLNYYRNEQEVSATSRGSIPIIGAKTLLMSANQIKVTAKNGQIITFKTFDQTQAHQWLIALGVSSSYSAESSIDLFKDISNNVTQVKENVSKLRDELYSTLENLKNCYNSFSKPDDSLSLESKSSGGHDSTVSVSSSDSQSKLKKISQSMRDWKKRRTSLKSPKMISNSIEIRSPNAQSESSPLQACKSLPLSFSHTPDTYDPFFEFCKYAQNFLENAEKYQCMIDLNFNLTSTPHNEYGVDPENTMDVRESRSSITTSISLTDSTEVPESNLENQPDLLDSSTVNMDPDEFFDAKSQLSLGDSRSPFQNSPTPESSIATDMNKQNIYKNLNNENSGSLNCVQSVRYRSCIPKRPVNKLSLFKLIKEFVGKDLTRISMPVNYNEPLSMLQRAAEALEYSENLDVAATCDDPQMQICHLAAFVISSYSSTALRTGKPFNPLLNETFEFDRSKDLGWKTIFEQVTHHPPMLASYTIGNGWILEDNLTVESNFNMNSITVTPKSSTFVTFSNNSHRYVWNRVVTNVRNIVMGNLWIEQCGVLTIRNETTGDVCSVTFHEHKMSDSTNYKKITGKVEDIRGNVKYILKGHYDDQITLYTAETTRSIDRTSAKQIWKNKYDANSLSADYYFFTEFTCSLNREDDSVAPTDSRRRPDQRALENGSFDEANSMKNQLEDQQRQRRRLARQSEINTQGQVGREISGDEAINSAVFKSDDLRKAIWFEIDCNLSKARNTPVFKYKGGYWEAKQSQDWSMCPSIFDH